MSEKACGQLDKIHKLIRKIRLLQEELKRLEVSLRTSKREINLKYQKLAEATGQFYLESGQTLNQQDFVYLLREQLDVFNELKIFVEKELEEFKEETPYWQSQ